MNLVIFHGSPVHGSAIYVRDRTTVKGSSDHSANGLEILRVKTYKLTITSVYKPPTVPFKWPQDLPANDGAHLVIGDFNSHSTSWAYGNTNKDGEFVEEWALDKDLILLNRAKDKPSFHSARWRRGYNPDLAFVSSRHRQNFQRSVGNPVPRSQHRPITVHLTPAVSPTTNSKPRPRFNYRRANWEAFTEDLETGIEDVDPTPESYDSFQRLVWKTAKKNIPRGCRKQYIPGLPVTSKEIYTRYINSYEVDPFAEETIDLGENLLASLSDTRKERWQETIDELDMTQNSKKAWSTIKKLNSDKEPDQRIAAVTPYQVAKQLLDNGKPLNKERGYVKKMKEEMSRVLEDSDEMFLPFSHEELIEGLKHLKLGKAPGLDGISSEMIKHFGLKTLEWLLALFNNCAHGTQLPKIWRRTKAVALLKPNKDPNLPKSYRPISLLCILFKLYERLIMARIKPTVEKHLTPDQCGFREGRSCCGQVLNLTQFIEDGFEAGMVTGAVFVDLTAAYDTVNHRALLTKVASMTKNVRVVRIIKSLLTNRRFFVEMDGKRSRWRAQKNGLPQGSVLAPMLFNIYTNDQPTFNNIRRFIYADDLCLATQAKSFESIEKRLTDALEILSGYYRSWFLNANPGKTQVCAFHLNNDAATRKLRITWEGKELENTPYPVYLGVTLDRTLSFREHVTKLRKKVSSRNNLLSNLANSSWGADPKTLKQTALALCYSTAEYCAAVWERSSHAPKADVELNRACRTITGNLKATPRPALYTLAGICPPGIRRDVQARTERDKQQKDPRHPLHGHQEVPRRLRSRHSFMTVRGLGGKTPETLRIEMWKRSDPNNNRALPSPSESLPPGADLPRRTWVALKRARAKVARTGDNLLRWGKANSAACGCGEDPLMNNCRLSPTCTDSDLREANEVALNWIEMNDKL
ncbi:Hypp6921 [Branchiostoma lanceolatum]|uniref:Hypp6921 protein n=1 Tax=Branchiostoma lanceolatum TaxID=7740 RepID=A0A8K0E5D7_BRALA|nr:Hypp6921 [Branchiostoma lanceolatum]